MRWSSVRRGGHAAVGFLHAHGGLLAVLLVALVFRIIYLDWFQALPPSETYNFISIARGLPDGLYQADEKRLPFFPFLILLSRGLFPDWETSALVLSVGASLVSLIFAYALGRACGISRTALAAFLLVIQSQPQFFLASVRGYADTTTIALVLLGLFGVLRTTRWRGALATGVALGAATLTRYEGGAAAAVLLPLWTLFPGRRPRVLPLVGIMAFVVSLLPFLALSRANNRPVFGAGYLAEVTADPRRGASTVAGVVARAGEIWSRIGIFGLGEILTSARRSVATDPLGTPTVLTERLARPTTAVAVLAPLGLLSLGLARRWRALVFLVATFLFLTLPAAWYDPLRRYDAFLAPLALLAAAAGVSLLQNLLVRGTAGTSGKLLRLAGAVLLFVLAAGVWTAAEAEQVYAKQRKHNGRGAALYAAIRASEHLPGRIGFPVVPEVVRLHVPERWFQLPESPPGGSAAREANTERLLTEGVRYVVLPEGGPATQGIAPHRARLTALFESPYPDEWQTARIYELLPNPSP